MWVRFHSTPSLWQRYLLSQYCGIRPPYVIKLKDHVSPTWRRMLQARHDAELGIRWSLGQGDISFWFDTWLPYGPLSNLYVIKGPSDRKVSWFFEHDNWFIEKLLSVVPHHNVDQILNVPICTSSSDELIWLASLNGIFSSKSAWEFIRQRDVSVEIYRGCWYKLRIPTISIFCWRWLRRRILTDDCLKWRAFHIASKCQFCEHEETFLHLFFHCSHALSVWRSWKSTGHIKEAIPF